MAFKRSRDPDPWWMGEEGDAYRQLCRRYASDDLTAEQFAEQAEALVARAVASRGEDAYGYWRDLGAPLSLADELAAVKKAPIRAADGPPAGPVPAASLPARAPVRPQARPAAPRPGPTSGTPPMTEMQKLGRQYAIAFIGLPFIGVIGYGAYQVSHALMWVVVIVLFFIVCALHDGV